MVLPVMPPYIGPKARGGKMVLPLDSEIEAFADRQGRPEWRVEYFDDDGGCYVTIFAGPLADKRAREYAEALETHKLGPIPG